MIQNFKVVNITTVVSAYQTIVHVSINDEGYLRIIVVNSKLFNQ